MTMRSKNNQWIHIKACNFANKKRIENFRVFEAEGWLEKQKER